MIRATLRDSLVYGLASVLTTGLAIFLLPIYTRVLSTSEYGVYDLLITLGVLANLIVALEISQGLARYWADTQEGEPKVRLASTTLWFSIVMYGAFLVIALLLSPWLSQWLLGDENFVHALQLGFGFIAINGINILMLNQFRWELRSVEYAVISFFYAIMTLSLALIFCLWLGMKLEGVMLGQMSASLSSVLLSWWLLRRSFSFSFDFDALRRMLIFSIPLVPAGLSIFVSFYINRFALSYYLSMEEVGIFGIGSRIAGIAGLMIFGVRVALTPLVYKHYRNPETPKQVARLFHWFVSIALSGCLFLTLFAKEFLILFATPEYLRGAGLVIYLAPALLLSQMYIFAPGIGIRKKTHWQLWITILAAIVSVAGNFLLVPVWGTVGAAVATLLSSVVFFAAWLIFSQRLYSIPYSWLQILFSTTAFIACAALGTHLETMGFNAVEALIAKLTLHLILVAAIILSRLIPVSEIRELIRFLQRPRTS